MKKLIGSKGFYKMVLAICIPIVIQNGFTNLASLLDNIMIGQLGTLSMSGVSITNQLLQVFNVTIFGAMSGPGIFMAQFYGKKNKEGVENCFRNYNYTASYFFILYIWTTIDFFIFK